MQPKFKLIGGVFVILAMVALVLLAGENDLGTYREMLQRAVTSC